VIDHLPNDMVLRGARGEYRLISMIGRGGMGVVYRAQRLADNTTWALKEMRPPLDTPPHEVEENRKLFVQEATMLQTLQHPNLIAVVDLFEHDDRPCMVMEFVPGQTLEQRMRDANAPLFEQQVLPWGIQLCRVMTYLHTLNPPIIYRDLKPPNVMVTPVGALKLIDFGVARTYKQHKSKDTVAMGSAGYAPPEQYGKGQTDARSDVYALGATLLHLLTNLPPVPLQTPTPGAIRRLNPSVDDETEQAIIKAMALDPKQRFQSAAEMERALHARLDTPYVDPTTRVAPPPAVAPPPQPQPQPRPAPAPAQQATRQQPAPPAPAPAAGGLACANCGRVNKAGARFCSQCGQPLSGLPSATVLVTSPRGRWEQRIERVPLTIGRRDPRQNHYPQIDLAEHDKGIASRNHASIDRNGTAYILTDLGSTNGTTLNGAPLQPQRPYPLKPGDRIRIGEVELEFKLA
jgi:eukaryotic-like serine/threonine-protein kinase